MDTRVTFFFFPFLVVVVVGLKLCSTLNVHILVVDRAVRHGLLERPHMELLIAHHPIIRALIAVPSSSHSSPSFRSSPFSISTPSPLTLTAPASLALPPQLSLAVHPHPLTLSSFTPGRTHSCNL